MGLEVALKPRRIARTRDLGCTSRHEPIDVALDPPRARPLGQGERGLRSGGLGATAAPAHMVEDRPLWSQGLASILKSQCGS